MGEHERYLSRLRTEVTSDDVIYLSTPITTGSRLLDESLSPERQMQRNINHARAVAQRLRAATGSYVIDPTELNDVEGWEQADYHQFWVAVIRRWVRRAVFCDGWQYSTGCSIEFEEVIRLGLPRFDESLAPITDAVAIDLLTSAVERLENCGRTTSAQRQLLSHLLAGSVND